MEGKVNLDFWRSTRRGSREECVHPGNSGNGQMTERAGEQVQKRHGAVYNRDDNGTCLIREQQTLYLGFFVYDANDVDGL